MGESIAKTVCSTKKFLSTIERKSAKISTCYQHQKVPLLGCHVECKELRYDKKDHEDSGHHNSLPATKLYSSGCTVVK
jgi:hypothetical protein